MRFAKGWIWAIVFGIALLALIGWRVATRSQQNSAFNMEASGSRKRAPSVEVTTAKPADILNTVNVVGNVTSPQSVDLSPKITGRINLLQVRVGDSVTAGQTLVQIDPSDLNQQILQNQANVADSKSKLAQAELTQNATNVGITTNIQQQQAGVYSAQADYNQTEQNYNATVESAQASVNDNSAKLNAAQVQVQNAQAGLAQQQSNLQNAQTKYQRLQTLFTQGAIAQQDRDDALTAVQVQQQAVNVAQGQVAAAQAAVVSAQAGLSAAKDQLSITKKQGTANIAASKAKLVQAQAVLKAAMANKAQSPAYQASINALQAEVGVAQAELSAAQEHLTDTNLKSPINGAVTARDSDPGDLATPGKVILTVQQLDWMYVSSSIPMEESAGINVGMNAQITIDSLPGKVFTGPITNMNPSADPTSRQFGIQIKLANPDKVLKPGMYARIAIITQSVHAQATVPIEAITKDSSGNNTVTVVDSDSVAHVTPVTLGASDGKTTEITSGVKSGDQVVILSYSPVKDGQKVTLPGAKGSGGGGDNGSGSSGSGSSSGAPGGGGKGGHRRHQS